MSSEPHTAINALPPGLAALSKSWGWLLAMGAFLVVVGTVAITSAFVATMAIVVVFGTLLLVGAGVQLVGAFFARKGNAFFLELLSGLFYLVAGLLIVNHPAGFSTGLTLILAVFFMVAGLFRIVMSLADRFEGWPWVLLSGIVTLALGVLIWRQWPEAGLWVIGLFVGIEMIFSGWKWVMIALWLRNVPKRAG